MSQDSSADKGPDLAKGVRLADFTNDRLTGHFGEDEVLLVRSGESVFAISPRCTHYQGPLAEGVVDDQGCIRCPWHHARFNLKTGEATQAPAFGSLSTWQVERDGDIIRVTGKLAPESLPAKPSSTAPDRIVIIGGGGAGFAAAQMLVRRKFKGKITILSADSDLPVDRPNLSKDYLAGAAKESWMPLRSAKFYEKAGIDLRLETEVISIDPAANQVALKGGETLVYDRLLLATGAEPNRLSAPGAAEGQIHVLRSMADCRAIIAAAEKAKTALVIGASFIGLETAAALRKRGLAVHVVAPDKRPMERILGPEIGDFMRALHEKHGVVFHLEDKVARFDGNRAILESGATVVSDLVIGGIGVKPRLALAEAAGLTINRGVVVNDRMQTSAPNIYAAGDIARWPDAVSGMDIRVEHWVVATRQGQIAAQNMLGADIPYDTAPFFWTQHYNVPVNYTGHAEGWDELEIDGDVMKRDCLIRYKKGGRVMAIASIFRDAANLQAEIRMEHAKA